MAPLVDSKRQARSVEERFVPSMALLVDSKRQARSIEERFVPSSMELDGDTKRQARSIEGEFVCVGIDGPGVDSNRNGAGVDQDSPMRSGHSNVGGPRRNGCDEGVSIGRK
jgi:hypothetical protein